MIRSYDYVIFTSEEDYKLNTMVDKFGKLCLYDKQAYRQNRLLGTPTIFPAYYWRNDTFYSLFCKDCLTQERVNSIRQEMVIDMQCIIQDCEETISKAKKKIQALKELG